MTDAQLPEPQLPEPQPQPQPQPVPPGVPAYRISDAERNAVIERLQSGMSEGRISLYEFEERLDIVMNAKVAQDLEPAVADLPLLPRDVKAGLKRKRKRARQHFYAHFVPYLSVNGFLIMVWGLTTAPGFFWPAFPIGGWGIGIASHAAYAFSVGKEDKQALKRR